MSVNVAPATRCPHGRVVHWGDHGPDPRDGRVGAEVCVPCSPIVADLRQALHEVAQITGDARVRRIARAALDDTALDDTALDDTAADLS